MKILILGAGASGVPMASMLAKREEVSELVLASRSGEKVKEIAKKLGSDKILARRVDVSDANDLLKSTEEADVVINTSPPQYNLEIMEASLKGGANYVDFAAGFPIEQTIIKELNASDRWKDAGLTAVINQGGPYNLNSAVRYASEKLDKVDEIRFRQAYMEPVGKKELAPTWGAYWNPRVALLQWCQQPLVYEDGRYRKFPPFSGVEQYAFPEPVGTRTVCLIEYEPVVTIPRFIGKGLRYVDYKISPDILAGAFMKMGLAREDPIDVGGVEVAPIEVLMTLTGPATRKLEELHARFESDSEADILGCESAAIKGEQQGEEIEYYFYRITSCREDYRKWGTAFTWVAIPGAVSALMLGKGEIKTKGVLPPEGLEPEPFLARLREWGWSYQEIVRRELT